MRPRKRQSEMEKQRKEAGDRNGEDSCRLVIRASIVRRRNYGGS